MRRHHRRWRVCCLALLAHQPDQPHAAHTLDSNNEVDRAGERWWPVFGAVYFVVAVKRVRGMRLVGLVREQRKAAHAPAPVVATHHTIEKESE